MMKIFRIASKRRKLKKEAVTKDKAESEDKEERKQSLAGLEGELISEYESLAIGKLSKQEKAIIMYLKSNKFFRNFMKYEKQLEKVIIYTKKFDFFVKHLQVRRALLKKLKCVFFKQHDTIFDYGTNGTKFFIILTGEVSIHIPTKAEKLRLIKQAQEEAQQEMSFMKMIKLAKFQHEQENQKKREDLCCRPTDAYYKVAKLTPGKSFGELALINNKARTATCKAAKDCFLAALDQQDFVAILKRYSTTKKDEMVFLHSIPLFQPWSSFQLQQFLYDKMHKKYMKGAAVYCEGDRLNKLVFIVVSGEFVISKRIKILKEEFRIANYTQNPLLKTTKNAVYKSLDMAILTSGKLFGANEYVCKSKRMYTVRCKSSEGMVWFFKWSELVKRFRFFPNSRKHLADDIQQEISFLKDMQEKKEASNELQDFQFNLSNKGFMHLHYYNNSLLAKLRRNSNYNYVYPIPPLKINSQMIDYLEERMLENPEETIKNVQKRFKSLNKDKNYTKMKNVKIIRTTKAVEKEKRAQIKTKDLVNNYILERNKGVQNKMSDIQLISKDEMNPNLATRIKHYISKKEEEEENNVYRLNDKERSLYYLSKQKNSTKESLKLYKIQWQPKRAQKIYLTGKQKKSRIKDHLKKVQEEAEKEKMYNFQRNGIQTDRRLSNASIQKDGIRKKKIKFLSSKQKDFFQLFKTKNKHNNSTMAVIRRNKPIKPKKEYGLYKQKFTALRYSKQINKNKHFYRVASIPKKMDQQRDTLKQRTDKLRFMRSMSNFSQSLSTRENSIHNISYHNISQINNRSLSSYARSRKRKGYTKSLTERRTQTSQTRQRVRNIKMPLRSIKSKVKKFKRTANIQSLTQSIVQSEKELILQKPKTESIFEKTKTESILLKTKTESLLNQTDSQSYSHSQIYLFPKNIHQKNTKTKRKKQKTKRYNYKTKA